ncbi:MAG: hypothetical protein H7Y30_00920 [Pyrinomonadaceae bacterium]|nr:hypothetical protein [Pyrinomonadaceae bacterium]
MAVVLTDIQIAFAAGALFADAGAPVIEAAKNHSEASLLKVYCRYMLRSLVYTAVFLGPVATISLLAYPAWETQYISAAFDNMLGHPVNASYYGIFLMAVFAGGWFGNWLGFKWVLAGKRKQLRIFYLVLVAITFIVVWARYPAPVRIGTYEEFKRDPNALPYYTQDKTFFYCFLVLLLIAGLPLLIGFIKSRMEVKQVKAGSIEPLIKSPLPWPRSDT